MTTLLPATRSPTESQKREGKPIYKILHENPDLPEISPEHPYCVFDSVVLSALVYLPILNVPQLDDNNSNKEKEEEEEKEKKPVTVEEVCACTLNACLFGDDTHLPCKGEAHNYARYRKMFKDNKSEKDVLRRVKLLLTMGACRRYKGLIVTDFVSDYNSAYKTSEATQFAAVTFWARAAGLRVVVMRGTDGTKAGWKEDCLLASTTIVASGSALRYMQAVTARHPQEEFAVVGHSKGGHLALYGALTDPAVRSRLVKAPKGVGVINLDGPGLKRCDGVDEKVLEQAELDAVATYIPQTSVIGVTIKGEVDIGAYRCLRSKAEFVSQHCMYTWLFEGTEPVGAEQDDLSRYFEGVFKEIREKNSPEMLTETVFSVVFGEDDFMGGEMSMEAVLTYCINFLALDERLLKNLGALFSDIIMARLRKVLVPAARNKYYDMVIIASALITSLASVSLDSASNRGLALALDGIRRGAQKRMSFKDAARYIADEAFKVVAERLSAFCDMVMGRIEENRNLLCNTRKNSAYEVITRAVSFIKGIISTAMRSRTLVRTARFFGYFKSDDGDALTTAAAAAAASESSRDMPPSAKLAETVCRNAHVFQRHIDSNPPVDELTDPAGSATLAIHPDFGSDIYPKSDLVIDFRTRRCARCGLSFVLIDVNDPQTPKELLPPTFIAQRGVLHMKAFGIYIIRAFPFDKATQRVLSDGPPIGQACFHYLPRVEVTPVIAGSSIEIDYAPDARTLPLMRLDAWKKASWWLGLFRADGASIAAAAACGDFPAPGKALVDLPQEEGAYRLRFYTSFHAGWFSEFPINIERRHITSLRASRVLVPRCARPDDNDADNGFYDDNNNDNDNDDDDDNYNNNSNSSQVGVCVSWSSWSVCRKMYDWVGLFGEGDTLLKAKYLVSSEDYTVFSGKLYFALSTEETAALRAIRLYSNGNKDAMERTHLLEELDAVHIEDEEAVNLQRDRAYLTALPGADLSFRWARAPDPSAIFVISKSYAGTSNNSSNSGGGGSGVHIRTAIGGSGKFIGVRADGSVTYLPQKGAEECFDVVRGAAPGTIAFRSHMCSDRYLSVDSRGRVQTAQALDDKSSFAYSKVQKAERYALGFAGSSSGSSSSEDYLSAANSRAPTFARQDGKNEVLELFDLCNGRVVLRFANGRYLSASEKGSLSYSDTRGPQEVFTVVRPDGGAASVSDISSSEIQLKSSYGQFLFFNKRRDPFTAKNDYPGREASFRLERRIAYIQAKQDEEKKK